VPMMYIFRTCRSFIRTVPALTYDEHRPEDVDTSQEDHIADEWRYVCMARPISPPPPEKPKPREYDPLELDEPRRYDRYDFYRRY